MNIDGIPAYMINIIAEHMTTLVKGGMEIDVDTLHYAVAMADADVQSIGRQMLAGNHMYNREVIRDAIAAEVYSDLRHAVAA